MSIESTFASDEFDAKTQELQWDNTDSLLWSVRQASDEGIAAVLRWSVPYLFSSIILECDQKPPCQVEPLSIDQVEPSRMTIVTSY